MKQYKHKHTGHLATETHSGKNYRVTHPQNYTIPTWIIENSNDWEEVKEPDYLITAFKVKNGDEIVRIGADGHFRSNANQYPVRLDSLLSGLYSVEDGTFIIYSVKNKDGVEFTIGDRVYSKVYENKVITRFEIWNNKACVYIHNDTIFIELNLLEKSKEVPILVTEDGVELFNDFDKVFAVLAKANWVQEKLSVIGATYRDKDWKYFSTSEAREEYIFNNKPRYSLIDVESVVDMIFASPNKLTKENILGYLKQINNK